MEKFIHSEKKPEKNMLEIPNKYIPKLEQFQDEYPEIVYDPPFPKAEEELKKRHNKELNISPSNRPLPLNWAEYFHNNNRRPV